MSYKYKLKTKEELVEAIKKEIYEVQGTKDNPNWEADLNCIDTGLITDMAYLFSDKYGLEEFNGNISEWNVSNVIDISYMFNNSQFNQDISNWNVSNVKNMKCMFQNSKFNGDISKWNVSNVENMQSMFFNSPFDGDISNWDVSNVTDMSFMFELSRFNQDISRWNVSNVKNMEDMFARSQFNGDISNWDVSNVKDMSWMFFYSKFNRDISNWNINNVKNMKYMFKDSQFNGDIGSWPLKKDTKLTNISVSLKYNKLPDKIIYPETVANIFIRSINYSDKMFNMENFKNIFKEFLKNRKEIYKNKGYKFDIINKLILNDVTNILKYLKDKNIQDKFMEITKMMNKKNKKLEIDKS